LAMNGATFNRGIRSPLMSPTKTPSTSAITMISGMLKNKASNASDKKRAADAKDANGAVHADDFS